MGSKGKRARQRRRVRPRRGGRRRPPPEKGAPRPRDDAVKLTKSTTVSQLLDSYREASFQARALGKAAGIFEPMLRDRQRPTIFLGLAGSLIAAGMRQVIVDLIEQNMVDVVVSTGAIISQDYYQVRGGRHFHGTRTPTTRSCATSTSTGSTTRSSTRRSTGRPTSRSRSSPTASPGSRCPPASSSPCWAGRRRQDKGSILGACSRRGVPLFVPALNDSSIGIGLTEHYHRFRREGRTPFQISSIADNYELTQIVVKSPATAALYISGGVPKNYINDSIVMSYIFGIDTGGHKYALQITTDAPHWGGLGGSTLSEATSWGKVSKKATHEMAFIETSVALPMLYGYALQKNAARGRKRLSYTWDGDILKSLRRA